MKSFLRTIGVIAFAAVMVTTLSARAHDVSGKWTGAMKVGGQDLPTAMILTQDGDKVTGKIGDAGKEAEMLPLTGTVDGEDLSITAKGEGVSATFKVKIDGDHATGTGTFQVGDMKMDATLDVKKG